MSAGYYENLQREIQVSCLGDYLTVQHAADLLGLSYSGLDSIIRRHGWAVVRIGDTRLLPWRDLPALRKLKR